MLRYPTYQVFLSAVVALFLTAVLMPLWIKLLRTQGFGQVVRVDGPHRHLTKEGTPTIGGLLILLVVVATYYLLSPQSNFSLLALGTIAASGLVGLWDDYVMIAKDRSLGLRARTKFAWQFIMSVAIAIIAVNFLGLSTDVGIPLTQLVIPLGKLSTVVTVGNTALEIPFLYILFLFVVISGSVNGVNLTDGLDGLAAGTVTVTMLAYSGIAFRENRLDMAMLAAAVGGACIGFLWYNCHPAEIFMGDTGSLSLGAAVASLAILTKTEILLVLIGGIYVIECLSVICQVLSFKFLGRRILKMAPIHHHFEMLGWSETKVIVRFWIISGMLAGAGFALYFISTVRRV